MNGCFATSASVLLKRIDAYHRRNLHKPGFLTTRITNAERDAKCKKCLYFFPRFFVFVCVLPGGLNENYLEQMQNKLK